MRRFIIYIFGFFVILIMLLGHRFVFAETFIINAGGSGEPLTDETNQFLSPLREVERLGTAKGARVFSLFNSDTWPKDKFTNPENVKPFNEENLLATLDMVKQRMKESTEKKQVMLHISCRNPSPIAFCNKLINGLLSPHLINPSINSIQAPLIITVNLGDYPGRLRYFNEASYFTQLTLHHHLNSPLDINYHI